MCDENAIVRERQLLIRREMDRRHISIKAVQYDGEWKNPSTVLSYFPNPESYDEPATMSVASLYRLLNKKALPAELLSMLLPDGFAIVAVPAGVDIDDVAACARDLCSAKDSAHHPDSEAGREIGPNERATLSAKVVQLRGRIA